jgi:site-specific recombinase XerD
MYSTLTSGRRASTWHTLRHTFASRLLDRGVDIITVKELLGHSAVIVTMRYTHTNLDSKVRAVGKLAGDCYNPATPCIKMQQSVPKVSQIGR